MALFNGSGQWGHIICGVKILKHNAVYRFKVEYSKLYMQGKQKICMYLFLNDYSLIQSVLDGRERVISFHDTNM